MLGYLDDLYRVAGGFGLFGSAFVALAAHLVAVPAVVADKLEALVGDVLGDLRDEVAGTEDLKVALNPRVETGAVDDRPLCQEHRALRSVTRYGRLQSMGRKHGQVANGNLCQQTQRPGQYTCLVGHRLSAQPETNLRRHSRYGCLRG